MGSLRRFKVEELTERHGLSTFVETGTGRGDSLIWAAQWPGFQHLLSCEIEPLLAVGAIALLNEDRRVSIARMESGLFIRLFAASQLPPALVWLDAHYPGAGFGLGDYNDARPDEERLPLERELLALAERPAKDLIIIDDLRIYETGDYEDGPLPADVEGSPTKNGANWIRDMFPEHQSAVVTRDQGYLLLFPRF